MEENNNSMFPSFGRKYQATEQEEDLRKKRCRYCGAKIQMDAAYCPSCGKSQSYVHVEPQPEPEPQEPQFEPLQPDPEPQQPQPQQEYVKMQAAVHNKGKHIILLLVPLLLLVLLCIAGGGWLAYQKLSQMGNASEKVTEEEWKKHYQLYGTIDTYPVTMQLNIDSTDVTGTYYYNRKGPDFVLTLRGSVCYDGGMYLNEYDEKGIQTGHFNGYIDDGEFHGEFVTNKGKRMHFSLKESSK